MNSEFLNLGIDISKITRPILGSKPVKPAKPIVAKKNKIEKKVYWKTSAIDKKFNLVSCLSNVPKEVAVPDLEIWFEKKASNDYWNNGSVEVFIGTQLEAVDPKYTAAQEKYEKELTQYTIDNAKWEADKANFEEQNDLYEKYKDLVDLKDQKQSLNDKLSKLLAN